MRQKQLYYLMLTKYPDAMNVRQVSKALDISTKTIYKEINNGSLHAVKIGREFRIPKPYVIDLLCAKDKGV